MQTRQLVAEEKCDALHVQLYSASGRGLNVTVPGGQSFRLPWASFCHPLPVVRGL